MPLMRAGIAEVDNEATYAYAAGDQTAYEADAEGGAEIPELRGLAATGRKRCESENYVVSVCVCVCVCVSFPCILCE